MTNPVHLHTDDNRPLCGTDDPGRPWYEPPAVAVTLCDECLRIAHQLDDRGTPQP